MASVGVPSAGASRESEGPNSGTIRMRTTGAHHASKHIRHGPNLNRVASALRDLRRASGPAPRGTRAEAGPVR